jgi:hypothetical protein
MEGRMNGAKAAFVVGLVAVVALTIAMAGQDAKMKRGGGSSIVQFELAGSAAMAHEMLDVWGPAGRDAAHRSLELDLFYIPAYVLTIGSVVWMVSRGWHRRLAPWLIAATIVAGGLDYVENVLLFRVLRPAFPDSAPSVAAICAAIKFGLLAVAIGFVAVWAGAGLIHRIRPAS